MARKRVSVFSPHSYGVVHHITHRKAFGLVANKKAQWLDGDKLSILLFDSHAVISKTADAEERRGGLLSLSILDRSIRQVLAGDMGAHA